LREKLDASKRTGDGIIVRILISRSEPAISSIHLDDQSKGSIEHFDVEPPKYGIAGTRDRNTCLLRNKYATTSGINQVGAGSLMLRLDRCVFDYKVK
jgi:hypothetical protein